MASAPRSLDFMQLGFYSGNGAAPQTFIAVRADLLAIPASHLRYWQAFLPFRQVHLLFWQVACSFKPYPLCECSIASTRTNMTIGNRIKTRRKYLGITQVELAERAHVSESVICRIELGVRAPDMALVQRLATALETTAAYLLDGTDPGNASNGNHAERAKQLEQRVEQLEEEVSGGRRMITFLQGVIDRLLPGSRKGEE